MGKMTNEEYLKFISEGTKTAHLATVKEDGSPHVVPCLVYTRWRQDSF